MKIAFFSPLNPLKSGISDYSEELLPSLSKYMTIDIFLDNFEPVSTYVKSNFKIYRIDQFEGKSEDYDHIIYHIGNNEQFHGRIYETALKYPGIVVIHDYALHHLIAQITVGKEDWNAYIEEMEYNYGEKGRQLAVKTKQGLQKPIWETEQTLLYPVNRRLINSSKAIIVHSNFAMEEIIKVKKDVLVQYAPLFSNDVERVSLDEQIRLKQKYNIKPETVVFSSFGFISRAKRIDLVIDVLEEIKNKHNNFVYLLVGEEEKGVYEMSKYIKQKGLNDWVKYIGFVNLDEFKDYIKLSDVCINLRYPTQGETSASLLRILGYGKPCIVTNIGTFAELNESIGIKINLEAEKDELKNAIIDLLQNEKLRREMGDKAFLYISKYHNLQSTVNSYVGIINRLNNLYSNEFISNPRFYIESLDNLSSCLFDLGIDSENKYLNRIANIFGEISE